MLTSSLSLLLMVACTEPPPTEPHDTGGADPCVAPTGEPSPDPWGGDTRVDLGSTGFFRVEQLCQRWWLVTPDGHPAWSMGVNSVSPYGSRGQESGRQAYRETVEALYESDDHWADATAARLKGWGLNTAASWSNTDLMISRIAVTPNLALADHDWQTGERGDWFSPEWEALVEEKVRSVVEPLADHPAVIGWFLDNEIGWGPDWRGLETLLQSYLAMDATRPGKAVAVDLLLGELGGVEEANALLGTDFQHRDELLEATDAWQELSWSRDGVAAELTTSFLELAADRYFATTTGAIRGVDPNHLVLGNREVSVLTRPEVHEAAGRYVDVISMNNYVFVEGVAEAALTLSGGLDPKDGFQAFQEIHPLPMLVSEFGFRAADSGLPNTWPPIYPTLETQEERAAAFTEYAGYHQAIPWMIGYHWFQWVDQPAEGRFDGENNNWGLVSEDDEPYELLTGAMTEAGQALWTHLQVPPG